MKIEDRRSTLIGRACGSYKEQSIRQLKVADSSPTFGSMTS